jgi:hypothetical protein
LFDPFRGKSEDKVRLWENDFLHFELNARRRDGMYDFAMHVRSELIIHPNFSMRPYNSDAFIDVSSKLDERKQLPWSGVLRSVK